MTRKPLPKAITRPIGALREFGAHTTPDEEAPAAPPAAPASDQAEPGPAMFARPVANDEFPPVLTLSGPQAAKRRSLAQKIVARHRTYAAVSGLSPLPIANIAGVTAVIVHMVQQLSALYGVPFERDRTRAAIIGLMGGAVPTGFGAATASTLAFVVPGGAVIGLAVSAITAGALTRGIGLIFLDHFDAAAA